MSFRPPIDVLPHRAPFLFLDDVIAVDNSSARGVRTFRPDEEFFRGHFPGRPIVPGVLLLEGMAQTFAYLALLGAEAGGQQGVYLVAVDRAHFRKPVGPGERVEFTVHLESRRLGLVVCQCEAYVGENKVADARLTGMVGALPT